MHGLIVTGISTEVGKTVVSAVCTQALKADYWKPVEAGGCDTETVRALSGAVCHPPAYRLKLPLSPHTAALIEKIEIEPEQIVLPQTERLIVEGCGGVMTPYGDGHLGTLFAKWDFPWIVVSKNYLGSINHTLLTLEWLQTHRQTILGVIFNGIPCLSSEHFILSHSDVRFLGRLLPEEKLTPTPPADYQKILGGHHSRRYLDRLELAVCRLTKEMIYPLVTYAIEKRAQKLYPAYHKALREMGSKVSVMSIIKEEEGHLEEMERVLADHPFKKKVCEIEASLFNAWFLSVSTVGIVPNHLPGLYTG